MTRLEVAEERASHALAKISHRGPDSGGNYKTVLSGNAVFFAHRRLSIIDLTSKGAQPFLSKDGRYALTYNGEIYNFIELRLELQSFGELFETDSDTEVLLSALSFWGEEAIQKLEGMFAFALLDNEAQTLLLARDAFGVKPLYYVFEDEQFFFASEPIALLDLAQVQPSVNHFQAISFFLDGRYDHGDETFFENVYQVLPGESMNLDLKTLKLSREQWLSSDTLDAHGGNKKSIRAALEHSVMLHLRSDVPIAAALSGGIDSSALSALVAGSLDTPLTTFGFCSNNPANNEEKWQDLAKEKLKLHHKYVRSNSVDVYSDLKEQIQLMAEPFGSTSLLAQRAVFRAMADSGFKVSLDGQGADELFGGYDGYPQAKFLTMPLSEKLLQFRQAVLSSKTARGSIPLFLAETSAELLGLAHSKNWVIRFLRILTVNRVRASKISPRWLLGYIFHNQRHVNVRKIIGNRHNFLIKKLSEELWVTSLPALLKNADRNSMAASIESRVPFLTLEIASVALHEASKREARKLGKKTQLSESIAGLIPSEIITRTDKIGFTGNDLLISTQGVDERMQNLAALSTLPWLRLRGAEDFPVESWTSDPDRDFRMLMLALWLRGVVGRERLER